MYVLGRQEGNVFDWRANPILVMDGSQCIEISNVAMKSHIEESA